MDGYIVLTVFMLAGCIVPFIVGSEYYPQIVEDDTFAKVQEIRENNARSQNRIRAYKIRPKAEIGTFSIGKVKQKYDDPYKQAEHAYSQITEVVNE